MSPAIRQAKRVVLGTMRWGGALNVLHSSRWREQKLLILAYHGVAIDDEHEWDPECYMPQHLFRRRMQVLRRYGCTVLPLGAALDHLYAGDLPPRAVALTFDDGTRDFVLRALPVLDEFGYPATVYLTTYYCSRRYPVFNVLVPYLLWKARQRPVDFTGLVPQLGRCNLLGKEQRVAVAAAIARAVQESSLTNSEQMDLLRLICNRAGLDFDRIHESGIIQIMSPAEVAEVHRHGFPVEMHTHRHRTPNSEVEFRREIRENRDHIVQMCPPSNPVHFCYPCGVCRPAFLNWLRAEGVLSATTCRPGLAAKTDSPFRLPRFVDTCLASDIDFEAWITGAAQLLPRRDQL